MKTYTRERIAGNGVQTEDEGEILWSTNGFLSPGRHGATWVMKTAKICLLSMYSGGEETWSWLYLGNLLAILIFQSASNNFSIIF